jgi:adenylosuccinate lyase
MEYSPLTAISAIDGRYATKTRSCAEYFSESTLIGSRLKIEIEWLKHLANISDIKEIPAFSETTRESLDKIMRNFSLNEAEEVKNIEKKTNHDLKAVEYYLKNKMDQHESLRKYKEFVHFGCTSEDVNNLSYGLMFTEANQKIIVPTLQSLLSTLQTCAHRYADCSMLSKTHGQAATPTTLGKEFANFSARLKPLIKHLEDFTFPGKLNGATGNFNAFLVAYPTIDWQKTTSLFIEGLSLTPNSYTTQIEPHDGLVNYFQTLAHINSILLDFSRDMWGYISIHYFTQKVKEEEVGSSTMPHKVNPIDFENAEGNLGVANALLMHFCEKLPISRYQRDLSDSTVLRNVGTALSHAYLAYTSLQNGIKRVSPNFSEIESDLNKHWEILAEPIQTVMRQYGIENPYEQLKELSRGNVITKEMLHQFIDNLTLPAQTKKSLKNLTPHNYIGLAATLAKNI